MKMLFNYKQKVVVEVLGPCGKNSMRFKLSPGMVGTASRDHFHVNPAANRERFSKGTGVAPARLFEPVPEQQIVEEPVPSLEKLKALWSAK